MNVRITLTDSNGKDHATLIEGFNSSTFTNNYIKAMAESLADLSTYTLSKLEKGGEYTDIPVNG